MVRENENDWGISTNSTITSWETSGSGGKPKTGANTKVKLARLVNLVAESHKFQVHQSDFSAMESLYYCFLCISYFCWANG